MVDEADAFIDRMLTNTAKGTFGKFSDAMRQQYGRVYRSGLWHLMKSDPHDQPELKALTGWKWLEPDTDPCDDWPFVTINGVFVGFLTGYSYVGKNNG